MTQPLNRSREEAILRTYPTPGTLGTDVSPVKTRAKGKPARYSTPKKPGMALPACSATWKNTFYKPERASPLRPGSEDFLACPSRTGDKYRYPLTGETI